MFTVAQVISKLAHAYLLSMSKSITAKGDSYRSLTYVDLTSYRGMTTHLDACTPSKTPCNQITDTTQALWSGHHLKPSKTHSDVTSDEILTLWTKYIVGLTINYGDQV